MRSNQKLTSMTKTSFLFLDSNIILGAAQEKLKDYLKIEVPRAGSLIQPNEYHRYSLDLIEKSGHEQYLERFTTYTVKIEVNKLVSDPEIIEKKIVSKIWNTAAVSGLSEDDKKIIMPIIYRVFFLKLPGLAIDLLNHLSSKSVEENERKQALDELKTKVFIPIFRRKGLLKQHLELSGQEHLFRYEQNEYQTLLYVFERFGNWDQNRDVKILAEAICCFRRFKEQYKETPNFYFVSNDRLFRANRVNGGKPYLEIINAVYSNFEISLCAPKHAIEQLNL